MSFRPRRRFLVLPAIALLGIVCVAVAARPMLRAVGWALVVDERVEPADIIVVPQWTGSAGAIDAADLVHSGIASRVAVLAAPPKPAELELTRRGISYQSETADLVQLLRSLGVAQIDVIANPADGTEAEGQLLPSWCDQHQVRSLVVVSAPDHSRRVRRVLHRSLAGRPTKVVIRSARYSLFDPDRWWETRDGIRTGIVELEKLLLDIARHPIS
jgi:hypothetical protein